MRAGQLNRRITIQQRDPGTDSSGAPLQTWKDVVTVWSNIAGYTGMRSIRITGEIPATRKRYSFRIRYRDGIDEGMRVVYNGQNFDIREVRMDFAGMIWTDLVCELGSNDG